MTSQIFLITNIEILVILPYMSNCFITSELYTRPSILTLGTMALFKIIITITMTITMNIDDDFNNNISKYY